jgi:hypothetical protein
MRDGNYLTAARVGVAITGDLDATGCDIGVYNPTSVSALPEEDLPGEGVESVVLALSHLLSNHADLTAGDIEGPRLAGVRTPRSGKVFGGPDPEGEGPISTNATAAESDARHGCDLFCGGHALVAATGKLRRPVNCVLMARIGPRLPRRATMRSPAAPRVGYV